MNSPLESAGRLSRSEKQELLRRVLVESINRARMVPASFAQERLWFLDRMHPAAEIYNLRTALRITGPLHRPALERALTELVRRHESLRTVFSETDGAPVQVIAPAQPVPLADEDLSGAGTDALRRRAHQIAIQPFDLAAGPLFRATLLRLAADEHVLLLCMHHIVSDGWSMEVIVREVSALYAAYRDGHAAPLPEPALQYADHVQRQRERMAGEAPARELAWWKERLAGAPALLELPTDLPRPAERTFGGAKQPVAFSAALRARLEALARAEGATLYMVLLAAWQVVLAKYAGTDDVVVGTPVAGRGGTDVEGLVGLFVNTLVLRADLSGDPAFREVLRRARGVVAGAFDHQEVPFERVVAELHPGRALGHTPLFQVMFTLENAALPAPEVDGVEPLRLEAESETSKFDLLLALQLRPEGIGGTLEFSTDLFERATIQRMLGHLENVLEQAAADPALPLSHMELADAAERRQVVEEWNRTSLAYPADRSLASLFEEQAAATPDAPALVSAPGTVTYRALNARANRLAHHLAALGVGPEARVAVCQERGMEAVVSILAVIKASGAYVPLDPGYPAERLAWMLADSGARVLVTEEALRGALPVPDGMPVVSVDADREAIGAASAANPADRAGQGALAYVVYTSGSTGTPKGVAVEQRAVVRLVRGTDFVALEADDRVAQLSNLSFDAATFEIWGALLNGATLVGVPREVALAPAQLARALGEGGITAAFLTTALFNQIAAELPAAFATLRHLLFGGEAVDPGAVRRVLAAGAPRRLLHVYGPTENTTFSAWHPVSEVPAGAQTVPIGRPVAHSTLLVLDGALRPAPIGVPGELFVGGHGVARGYLNRPSLTAERFVPDPFSAMPGARMYRTGDRVRWLAEGAVEFGGRLDEQVKVRGFRVEPGEIEAALRRHPGVAECTVVGREDEPGDRRLVAYVVPAAAEAETDAEALRAHLRGTLPEYMVPAAFVALAALPLNPNGKVDRRALPAPDYAAAEASYVAPRTPAEEVLAAVWAEVLRVERVGAHDGFFELGGHSLLATRVVSRVREVFGVELPLRTLFESPTVAGLADAVEALRRAGEPPLSPVVPIDRTGALQLSFAQERLWFIDRMEPGSPLYNVPAALRLSGALDAAALEGALGEIVRRHEALRTTFRQDGGDPAQEIAPFTGFALAMEDLSALDPDAREARARRRAAEEAVRPFDLTAGPLFRAALLRLDAEEHVLLLSMHHVVSDGWSIGVLLRELAALYGAFREGRPSPLGELPVQYADFAAWQRAQAGGPALDRQLAYWKERLGDAPALLELPTDRPRPAVQSHRGALVPVELSAALVERLEALARGEGATLYMVLLSAFQLLLGRYGSTDDVVVGSPVAGRTRRETEGLIGFFVNTLVMRTDLSGDPEFRALLRRVREGTLGAYEHQDAPFERLVAELQPERSLSHAPLVQVMLALQNVDRSGGELPGVRMEPLPPAVETAKLDLTLLLAPHAGGLRGAVTYATDLFDPMTVERMVDRLRRVLEQVADDAGRRISTLELLDAGERERMLEAWNPTAPAPAELIHQRFEAQADRVPQADAVVSGDARLSYGELEARANRLAHHLVGLGVGSDTRVGIFLERGPELVVAVLGVLKAGGAYVPLDPTYPAGRLAEMLADAGAPVLVTQDSLRDAIRVPAGVAVVRVDGDAAAIAARPAERLEGRADARALAYVIYTSGSTGTPRGVGVPHGALANYLAWFDRAVMAEQDFALPIVSRLSFDAHVRQLYPPLLRGGAVRVLADETVGDPAALLAALGDGRGTSFGGVPTLWGAVVERIRGGGAPAPAGLGAVLLGGEALPAELAERTFALLPGVALWNHYGPTEATVNISAARLRPGGPVTIGRPVDNARVYLLDAHGRLVPPGMPGELCAGGAGVARGYLGRPAATAEKFVPDPFAGVPGARMYRTGDRARWRADGELEYLGRLDAQVKVRGFRIEPGEIEAALRRHASVRDCAVVARADLPGDTRLVAYVVAGADADALRAHLRRILPDYLVPGTFVHLDALPLTPSGKLDRRALPAPDYGAAEARVAPRTPVEEVLAEIWKEVLRLEKVGVDDDFFDLGGHSLLVTVLAGKVRDAFSVEMPLRTIFTASTIAEMAEAVESLRRAGAPVLPPVVAGGHAAPPLSFAQERLWFLDRLQPGSSLYNVSTTLWMEGPLHVAALERALGEIVRRHQALRTVFAETDGAPVQVIAPFTGLELPVDYVGGADAAARKAEAWRLAGEEAARPFDLTAGPLFRARLLRLGADSHVLLMSMHHVVTDGWTTDILSRELASLYGAFREGRPSPLPELPVQYADYAVWQREQLRGPALERQLEWWKERLAGAPALLELPTDHPRPALQSYRGATVPFELSAAVRDRLRAVGRRDGATLYMVLLGTFQVLLSRYSGSVDVVVGSPVAGRTRKELEGLAGFFVNTLALRTDLSGNPSFREVLRRVRETTLGAYEHQDAPFEQLVAELQPERSMGHSPIFQASFTWGSTERQNAALPGLSTRLWAAPRDTAKFDLTLGMADDPAGLLGFLEFSTDLFERETALRMLAHLRRVLEQVADDADLRLAELELLDADERRRVLEEWSGAQAPVPALGIATLFAEQAARTPDAVAVVSDHHPPLTYRELDAASNRLARHLARLGVSSETRVAVALERGPETIAAILAVLKAGGAYVPLDPGYPAERLAFMLADASVAVLLTEEALRERLPAPEGVAVLSLDAVRDEVARESADAFDAGAGPENLAYVMYTSGSTGIPRGVAVEQRSVVRLVRGADYAALGPDEVILQAAPVSFDAATLEIWGALLNGGRMVLAPGSTPSPEALGRTLVEHGVTTLWLTAGLFQVMVEERLDDFRGVRQLLAGGDVLPVEQVRKVRERFPALRLINGYGPTENTTFTCCHTVDEGWDGGPIPIGTPISGTRVYVLDAGMRPAPVGVPGELYAGGQGVARGYLNRPALVAERFVPDPFSAVPGARLYRTGDRVRWVESAEVRECGSGGVDPSPANSRTDALTHSRTAVLEFLGRVDTQVKIRGFRIEPGEVEAALRHAGAGECLVVPREDAPGDRRLVAYVVGETDAEALRAALTRTLPPYMVPAAFVALDAFPLTPNGKVDRRALPAPDFAAVDAYVAPRTPAEEVLAGIWADVLRVERVGVHDDFFALGGHSLLAMRVVSRVRETFGVELPLRALFEAPSVAGLADATEALRMEDAPPLPPVVPVERTGEIPLSFAQERLWFLDRMEPDSPFYSIPAALRLTGALDVAALEGALGGIVQRHESLRTTFAEHDGRPVQVIAPFTGFTLSVEDLSPLDDEARTQAARRRSAEHAATPFDLARGPLFRAALLRLGGAEHVLLLSMHHIVSDGWSIGVLLRELSVLYGALRDGEEPTLPELAVQYADFTVWQRRQLDGPALEGQITWWKERLAGAPALLELPTDRPRPAMQSYVGGHASVELPGGLAERLRALGRGEGATLYMVLLAAFQVLLSRYAASHDVVVGTPVAGRTRGETEGLIGFFVNTLVMRADLSGDPTFRQVLRQVRETTLGAYEHQEVPFERLVAELQPERSLGHSPLFQVMFALEDAEGFRGGLPGVRMEVAGAGVPTAKFDLDLSMVQDESGVRGVLAYAADLFDPETARRMTEHLVRLLEAVADGADLALSRLTLLDDGERARVLEEWNRTESDLPADVCLHQLVEAQVRRTPDAPAVVAGDTAWTYAELDARADALARRLAALGVGPESRVAVCLERSPQLIAALLGVMKAGGACVPLDPRHPAERLALMLDDSRAAVVVTQESVRGALPAELAAPVVLVDAPSSSDEAEGGRVRGGAVPGNLAYVIYTSGSTGTPKGVGVEHRSVANYVAHAARAFELTPADRVLQFASASFDTAAEEIYATLVSGAALVLRDDEMLASPEAFWETCRRGGLTVLDLPTAVWHDRAAELEAGTGAVPDSVRLVVIGGERALPERMAAWRRALEGRVRLMNTYGPTESTICATAWDDREWSGADAGAAVPIGRPVANTRVYVLDASLAPLPAGLPGELCVAGVQVARGYLGRPAATAERFVPDPFAAEPGGRLYRTGDRARWRVDGTLEYLGRLDGQVKVRGFRIEPGEVEAALRGLAGVDDCVVVPREDVPGDTRLVAYVVGAAQAADLRAGLRRTLPEYMVPAAFVTLGALPLTVNGKLDRRALPAPEYGSGDRLVVPMTPAEELMAEIWEEVLGVERVGTDDNFFALGGHSLLATVVVGMVRKAFQVEMPLRVLFEGPTVAEMAHAVEALRREGLPVLPPVVRTDRSSPLPLSFAQERLWFLDQLQPGNAFYNTPTALRLEGELDVRALERGLGEIVRRHEALRTVFREVGHAPVQVVAPFTGFALPVEDLSGLHGAEREAVAARRAQEEAARPFDLAAGPVFRARLLRLAEDDHLLILAMHHIVTDWWSTGILARELSTLYTAFRDGRPSPLAEPAVQYPDFAVWQRRQLQGEVLDRQMEYWKARLAGAPALLELPTDRPRPPVQSFRGGHVAVEVSGPLLDRLKKLAHQEGVTLYMVLLGAFQLLLSRWSGSDDVVVGSPIAGRTRREVAELIGFFVNTLVLRTDLSGDPGFREVLRRVREVTLGAYDHQDVPFEKLVAELQPERSLGHSPLFQAAFTWGTAHGAGDELPGLRARPQVAAGETAKFDLNLGLADDPRGVIGFLEYSADLWDRAGAERLVRHLYRVLEQVAAKPDLRLSKVELADAAERRRVVEEWNQTDVELPAGCTLHGLFAEQAARTPGAVAVVFEGQALTYAELDGRANRLASHLRRRGVGPETRVGVCLERGIDLVVSLLAVLKAGGAYLPLDPGYPAERLEWMLADAGGALVVTDEALRGTPAFASAEVVSVDGDAAAIAAEDDGGVDADVEARNAAYVIYTSGSTGRPKGVVNEHRGIVNRLRWMQAEYGLGSDDAVLQKTPFGFDVSVWEFFWPLLAGARLVVARPGGHRDPRYLQEVIEDEGITTLHFVPSMLRPFVEEADPSGCGSLRRVICSGEALPPALVERFHQRMPRSVELHNLYGPTEAAVDVTYWHCARAESVEAVPIGRPVWNTRLYVLDEAGQPVPAGLPGELFIGGVQVARGYLARPGLTAERFIPDPFSADPGARLYRTGDRARWSEGGELEYLGRMDHQVKIRGFRIEPGEVEAALCRIPGVDACAVVAREDHPGEMKLVAYVVGDAEADTLRSAARRTLPDHLVPAAFVPLDALPLTSSGKLDRRALPAPGMAAPAERHVAPRTPAEAELARIWGEVLRLERVGVHDDFFAIGGHSLLATQVASRIRESLDGGVGVIALFEHPTVAGLAAYLEERRAGGQAPAYDGPMSGDEASPDALLAALGDLSDEEMDRLIGAHLEGAGE
jgi:amino acid adenylation domain-containing protein